MDEPRPGQTTVGAERIRLVWIGQRAVPGVTAGCRLHIRGFLSVHDDVPTVFNPRYDLVPKDTRD